MAHSESYNLFTHYWWLLFPFFWMVGRGVRLWSRHSQAKHALTLIKSYADQGKEPPPELLQALRPWGPEIAHRGDWDDRRWRGYGWIPICLFTALAGGFVFMAFWPSITDGDPAAQGGLIFVAILMGGLALGFLVVTLTSGRPDDRDSLPPR
jgi:hypothetical protein